VVPLPPLENVGLGAALLLFLYALLGVITGLAATGFIRGLPFLEDQFDRIKGPYTRHVLGMLLVGMLIYGLQASLGHYYVEGVGYATVQAIVFGQLTTVWLLALLFVAKLFATTVSLGSGASGGIFSPSLFMGATIGGAFASALAAFHLPLDINVPAFAMVGMGAMVGGGTGAAMTAVTMIFEMTRDYNIVLPMIIAVAFSLGVRRVLSPENIYTLKLARRGHLVPKALYANMFLVRRAAEVMETDVLVLPAETAFDAFLSRPEHGGRMRHVIVTRENRIFGVVRVNTGLRRGLEGIHTGITLGDVARPNFTIVRENDVAFEVIQRIWRRRRDHGACRARRRRAAAGEHCWRDHQGARRRLCRRQRAGLPELVPEEPSPARCAGHPLPHCVRGANRACGSQDEHQRGLLRRNARYVYTQIKALNDRGGGFGYLLFSASMAGAVPRQQRCRYGGCLRAAASGHTARTGRSYRKAAEANAQIAAQSQSDATNVTINKSPLVSGAAHSWSGRVGRGRDGS
jgi:Voltage gated chloride channel